MVSIQIVELSAVIGFWLAFTKMLTILVQIPLFDEVAIPNIVKILAALIITFALYPSVSPQVMQDIDKFGADNLIFLTIVYAATGLLIGFMVKSLMQLFISAGSIITQQIGFGAVRYFDPNAGAQVGPFEKLLNWTILIMILTSGALIPMFKGIKTSFFTVHAYDVGRIAQYPLVFVGLFKSLFISSILLAGPLIFTNLLIMCVLGIIARTVPQMNVLMVSFVLNIGVGLFVFSVGADEFFHMAFKIYTDKLGEWFALIT